MVDKLAAEYDRAGKPVLFLEQNANTPLGNRVDRWWEARDGESCGVPWVIVDSGFRVTCGWEDFEPAYRALVDAALATPPTAQIAATYRRLGSDLTVTAEVTNRSAIALGTDNWATVNVLVFERAHVVHTERFVRAAGESALLTALAPGRTRRFEVPLGAVPVTDWTKATVVVLVDHQPGTGAFLALQSAIATDASPALDAAHLLLPRLLRHHLDR